MSKYRRLEQELDAEFAKFGNETKNRILCLKEELNTRISALQKKHYELPQIAAMADSHFEIEKNVEENETVTSIHPLSEEDSVRELARMLGGAKITDSVLENASEMKELAQVQKSARLK